MEPHFVGIDDLDLAHLLLEDPGALGAQEAELHVLGGEEVSVVELEALPQLELVGLLVGTERPRLGQARRHDAAGHRLDQRVVERVLDPERRDEALHLAWIEPGRGHGHVEGPAHLAFRLRLLGLGLGDNAASKDGAQGRDDEKAERSRTLHTTASFRSVAISSVV